MARSPIKVTVTTMAGERVTVDVAAGNTGRDVVAALVQNGKLQGEDSHGQPMQYELAFEAGGIVPGDQPLMDVGASNGSEFRVKPGARVGAAEVR